MNIENPRPSPTRDLRSFGRRRGRKLSPRQQALLDTLLPKLRLDLTHPLVGDDLANLFPIPVRETWLEIGFGGGEHLIWQAKQHSEVGLIGCEPFADGIVKVLTAIEEQGLANIRIHDDDARQVIDWLPDGCLARVILLFPDPWPKKRHHKRRLMSPEMLTRLARVMQPGAELRFATDIADYARVGLGAVHRHTDFTWAAQGPSDWRQRPADWPPTRYEAKAHREGRACVYLRFIRRGTGAAAPLRI